MRKTYIGIIFLLLLVAAGMAYATAAQSSANETDATLAVEHYGSIVASDCTLGVMVENKENKPIGIDLIFNGVEWNSSAPAGHRAFGSVNVPYNIQGNQYIYVTVTGTIGTKVIQENYNVLCASDGGSGASSRSGAGSGTSRSSTSHSVSSALHASGNTITAIAQLLGLHGNKDEDD